MSLFTGGPLCFQGSNSLMGIPFIIRQLKKCKSFRETWAKLVCSIFPRTHERLAEISTKLEVEKQQNRSSFIALSTRPVLEPPCVGNFNNPLVLHGSLTPRANVGFSTSIPRRSDDSVETYLTKVSSILFFSLGVTFLLWMILVFNLVNFWVVFLSYAH